MSSTERPALPNGARYNTLSAHLKKRFSNRVYKVTLRGGFGCPNRDGQIGSGGCTFCAEGSLEPRQGQALVHGPIPEQLAAGFKHVDRAYPSCGVIAYFQEGTSTDGPLDKLKNLYEQAIAPDRVVALSIGTRPDCLPEPVMDLLADLAHKKPVWLEMGLQIASDTMLKRLNRNHTVADFTRAVDLAHQRGLEVIAHVILDLPGENAAQRKASADCLNELGVEGVKIHNLHVLSNTLLAEEYRAGLVQLSSLARYADKAIDFLEFLRPEIVVHRLTGEGPPELMVAPTWGRKKKKILATLMVQLERRDTWQGRRYEP